MNSIIEQAYHDRENIAQVMAKISTDFALVAKATVKAVLDGIAYSKHESYKKWACSA